MVWVPPPISNTVGGGPYAYVMTHAPVVQRGLYGSGYAYEALLLRFDHQLFRKICAWWDHFGAIKQSELGAAELRMRIAHCRQVTKAEFERYGEKDVQAMRSGVYLVTESAYVPCGLADVHIQSGKISFASAGIFPQRTHWISKTEWMHLLHQLEEVWFTRRHRGPGAVAGTGTRVSCPERPKTGGLLSE